MSKISLAPDASGTGIFTIASPNSNTNRTLTLPDDTGTIVTNSGNQAGSFTTLNTSGAVVFNDAGADVDFRVEGDTDANLLFVDASADAVGFGTSSPTEKVHSSNAILAGGAAASVDRDGAIIDYAFGFARFTAGSASGNAGVAINVSSGGTQSEAARFDASGNLLVGATSPADGDKFNVTSTTDGKFAVRFYHNTASTPVGLAILYSAATPNNTGSAFLYCQDSTSLKMEVRSNGGIANYSANNANLSDRREKTNFAPAKNYLDTICAIPVQTFNYIDQNLEEDDGLTLGVVAQDVQEVAPELVMESNWGTQEEPKMRLSIYQTDLQYALMKCIQELKAELDEAKARIAALETGA